MYTVTFDAMGGTFADGNGTKTETVESGRTATKPDDPTLEGSWFSGWYGDSGLTKEFDFTTPITADTTVYAKWSYKLHTGPTKLTDYTSPNNTGSEWTYVEFGEWPQTIKAADVTVDETKSKAMGMFTCYLGSDSNYYVKHSNKYYKVEPIVWRVLTEDYKDPDGQSTGNALLLAEKILTCGIPYYVDSNQRTIGEKTVYPNNWQYSTIRAWLNGSYEANDTQDKTYDGIGFLQTAFTQSARDKIADTTVDNSAASTNPASNPTQGGGSNKYASDTPTTDKIFLLSEAEATTSEYGFGEYDASGQGNTRIRVATDYAKATGVYYTEVYGGWWRLRSPDCDYEVLARYIFNDGYTCSSSAVNFTNGGVVPALSISLK